MDNFKNNTEDKVQKSEMTDYEKFFFLLKRTIPFLLSAQQNI